MHWYKIEVNKGEANTYHFVGRSEFDVDALTKRAEHGFFVRLDELLYMDRGQVKEWAEWDKTLIPSAYINSKDIVAIMEFKDDPRKLPRD